MVNLRAHWGMYRQTDYRFKTLFSSALSAVMGIAFALINAALGIIYQSVWFGSICVYYILLAAIRGVVVLSQRERSAEGPDPQRDRKVFISTHIVMIAMDLALIAPFAYLVLGQREYTFGLIPAIAMAAYVTYRIIMGIYQYRSSHKQEDLLVRELRVINLQDTLVAVLVLQNTLIIATGGSMASMFGLVASTSGAIWALIVFFTVESFLSVRKR